MELFTSFVHCLHHCWYCSSISESNYKLEFYYKTVIFIRTVFSSTYSWNFTHTHTHNFTLQQRRDSFAFCIIAILCGTYQHRLCALKLLQKGVTGAIRRTPTHLRSINNTATRYNDFGRMEGGLNLATTGVRTWKHWITVDFQQYIFKPCNFTNKKKKQKKKTKKNMYNISNIINVYRSI